MYTQGACSKRHWERLAGKFEKYLYFWGKACVLVGESWKAVVQMCLVSWFFTNIPNGIIRVRRWLPTYALHRTIDQQPNTTFGGLKSTFSFQGTWTPIKQRFPRSELKLLDVLVWESLLDIGAFSHTE